jgi:hypothetical protein
MCVGLSCGRSTPRIRGMRGTPFRSTLALFVTGVGANDDQATLTAHNLAVFTNALDTGPDFHGSPAHPSFEAQVVQTLIVARRQGATRAVHVFGRGICHGAAWSLCERGQGSFAGKSPAGFALFVAFRSAKGHFCAGITPFRGAKGDHEPCPLCAETLSINHPQPSWPVPPRGRVAHKGCRFASRLAPALLSDNGQRTAACAGCNPSG